MSHGWFTCECGNHYHETEHPSRDCPVCADKVELIKSRVLDVKKVDLVHSPQHYELFENIEAIEIIACALTESEFKGYCFGNLLKYRLRCGKKDNVKQELDKADKYKELYNTYKHLCRKEY